MWGCNDERSLSIRGRQRDETMSGLDGLGWPNPADEPRTSRDCAANDPSDATACYASLGDIQAAKKDRLNEGLRSLARWCADRSNGEHDTDTTLTMLEKKATALRGRVIAAGWAEIDRKNAASRHNASLSHGEGEKRS